MYIKKYIIIAMVVFVGLGGCKKKEKFAEPSYILTKWTKSIQELNYRLYTQCEAYPKTELIFREMYKGFYFTDMMVTAVEDPNAGDLKKDHEGSSYIHSAISFEGTVVNRTTGKPFQVIRGDAVFVKFMDGKRKNDGWLLSNRTFIMINR